MMSTPQNTPCVTVSTQKGKILKSLDHLILPHGDYGAKNSRRRKEKYVWAGCAFASVHATHLTRGASAAGRGVSSDLPPASYPEGRVPARGPGRRPGFPIARLGFSTCAPTGKWD